MTASKRLLCALPHSPAFDSCFPLLERLHHRGRIAPFVLLGPRLREVEPRAEAALRASGLNYKAVSLFRLEVASAVDILRADAILTHSDPQAYGGKFRLRDTVILRSDKPTIFVQHGMVQAGLHYAGTKEKWTFHAGLMLLWRPLLDPNASFFGTPVGDRIQVSGLIKANRLAPAPNKMDLERALGTWRQRVLICHNFGFESPLYPAEAQRYAFSQWAMLADSRKDTLFILRSHRGKRHKDNEALVAELIKGRPNIVVSERHDGLMRLATINDILSIVDRVISHPSTVVLDAIYDRIPIAVFNANHPELDQLPRADRADQIATFLDDPKALAKASMVRTMYGEIDANLNRAAVAVEKYLEGL